jgi:hypothetical protein
VSGRINECDSIELDTVKGNNQGFKVGRYFRENDYEIVYRIILYIKQFFSSIHA